MKEIMIYLKDELQRNLKNPQKSPFLIPGMVVLVILFFSGIYGLASTGINRRTLDRLIDSGTPHLVVSSRIELLDAEYNTQSITERLKRYNFRGGIKLMGTINCFEFSPNADKYNVKFSVDQNFDVEINKGENNLITYKHNRIIISTPTSSTVTVLQSESRTGTTVQILDLSGKINVDILHPKGASLEIMRSI